MTPPGDPPSGTSTQISKARLSLVRPATDLNAVAEAVNNSAATNPTYSSDAKEL